MGKGVVRSYRDLEVYQGAFGAAMEIFELSKRFPVEERSHPHGSRRLPLDNPLLPTPHSPQTLTNSPCRADRSATWLGGKSWNSTVLR